MFVIGLAVVCLGTGYMLLYSWLKPTMTSPARPPQASASQVTQPLMQPLEPLDTQAPAANEVLKSAAPRDTQVPTATPVAVTFPIRGAFYYPWFPEAWKQQNFDPFTHYKPVLGYYELLRPQGDPEAHCPNAVRKYHPGDLLLVG